MKALRARVANLTASGVPVLVRRHILPLAAGLLLCACGQSSQPLTPAAGLQPAPVSAQLPAAAPAVLELPAPRTLLQGMRAVQGKAGAAVEAVLLRHGADFSPALPPMRVSEQAETALYTPQWEQPAQGLPDLAYALYSFHISEGLGQQVICASFDTAPLPGSVYLALADFSANRWCWFAANAAGVAEFEPRPGYADGGDVLTVLVLSGTQQRSLNWLRLGSNLPPLASLVVDPPEGAAPLEVRLDASGSSDPEGITLTFHWDFEGDGTVDAVGTAPELLHSYADSGLYQPAVTVVDSELAACGAAASLALTGPPRAVLKAAPLSGFVPLEVQFDARQSYDVQGTIALYEWDLDGDGGYEASGAEMDTASHSYTLAGTFHPVLRVTDGDGLSATASVEITTSDTPQVVLSVEPASGQAPLIARFDASACVHPQGLLPVHYAWDFDGDTIWDLNTSGPVTEHTYLRGGVVHPQVRVVFSDTSDAIHSAQLEVLGFATSWGGDSNDYFNAAAALEGTLYGGGSTFSFGAVSLDGLLVRRDHSGNYAWGRTWGGGDIDVYYACTATPFGVYAGGYTFSYAPGGMDDTLLLKYSPAGELLWTRTWGRDNHDWIYDMTTDSSGDVWAVGQTYNPQYSSDRDILLLKYSPSGGLLFAQRYNSGAADRYPCVLAAPGGGVYISGRSSGTAGSGLDALLLRLDAKGELFWQKYWGGLDQDSFGHMCLDGAGNIYTAGYTRSFGGGAEDGLIAKLSADGTLLWAAAWGTAQPDTFSGVATDSAGNVYATGYQLTADQKYCALLLKWSADGALLGSWQLLESNYKDFWQCVKLAPDFLALAGCGSSAYGGWQACEGLLTYPTLDAGELTGTLEAATGITGAPEGTEGSVEGTEDMGGGGLDGVLIGYECR